MNAPHAVTSSPMTERDAMSSLSLHDREQVSRANVSTLQPVVFVHGLWLLSSSWERWAGLFEEAGYVAITAGWPDDPETVDEGNANPDVFADKTVGQVSAHLETLVRGLTRKPVIIGHSFGGMLAQMLAGRGLASVTVAIDPAPFRGVLPLPISALRAAWPVLGNPGNRHRAVPLSFDQFRFAFANAVEESEARELYAQFAVPAPGAPLFQAAAANLNPWTEVTVDTEFPGRGPMLVISGERDHTVPWAVANASFHRQQQNPGITEIIEMPHRGHSLTIDHGWREVAETALAFVRRFA